MKVLTLRILGECAIEVDEARIAPSAPHLFALMLHLGVERGREVPKSSLLELLFPGEPSSAAGHNLRQLLYRVRKLGVSVDSTATSVCLDADAVGDTVQLRLNRSYHESSRDPASSCVLLPGYQPPTAPFSKWLESYREGVQRALMRKLCDELQTARRGANWATVEAFASSLLTLDPFNETATLCLAESLARTGSKQRAVSLLEQFEQEVGSPASGLTLPARLLKRRIGESALGKLADPDDAPLVGRTREMEMLADFWAEARSGKCTAVSVTGEKSIGKSRLAAEFLSIVRLDESGSVVLSRRRPADTGRPLSLFADICKQLIGMPGAAGCAPSGLSYLTRLTTAPDGFDSLRSEQSEVQFSIGTVRRAILDLIECITDERPLALVIDDVQFLDDLSREILQQLFRELSKCRLLILLVGDAEGANCAAMRRLQLQSLDEPALARVAEHALVRHQWPIDDELLQWCVTMASGNAGYLEMLLQSARSSCGRELPHDLVALVRERIGALSSHGRHALQAIALFGAACDGDVVERLCGLKRTELLDALEELEARSMIVVSHDGISCRSALIEECTRACTPASAASVIHARAARYLERQSRRGPPSQAIAWRIAAHWKGAANAINERHWQRVCWRQSIAVGQPMLAVNAIRTALIDSPDIVDRAALLDDLANALFAGAEVSAAQTVIQARIKLCTQIEDSTATLERLQFDLIEVRLLDLDDPMPHHPRLLAFLKSDRLDQRRRIRAARMLMIAADNQRDSALARETYEANLDIDPADWASALLHSNTALIYHSIFGDRDVAMNEIQRLACLIESADPSWEAIVTRTNIALARTIVDPAQFNLSDLEKTFRECHSARMNRMAILIAGRLISCLIDSGEIQKAMDWVAVAEPLMLQLGLEKPSVDFLSCLADLAYIAGEPARAERYVRAISESVANRPNNILSNFARLHRLRFQQVTSREPISSCDLEWLLNFHLQTRWFGRHDDYVEVLWTALVAVGRHEEASEVLLEYLTHSRRERRACSYFLRMRTAPDPVWLRIRACPTGGHSLS